MSITYRRALSAAGIGLVLAGCVTLPPGIDIVSACKVFNIVKKVIAPFPIAGSAAAIIEAFVDPVCGAAFPQARDRDTGEWVLLNAAALASTHEQ